jgi:hypothetical protein
MLQISQVFPPMSEFPNNPHYPSPYIVRIAEELVYIIRGNQEALTYNVYDHLLSIINTLRCITAPKPETSCNPLVIQVCVVETRCCVLKTTIASFTVAPFCRIMVLSS